MGVTDHRRGIVPAELRPALFLQEGQQLLLAFVQSIQPYKDIAGVSGNACPGHLAVDHPLVCEPPAAQRLVELHIYGIQQIPDPEKTLLGSGMVRRHIDFQPPVLRAEMGDKRLNGPALRLAQPGIVILNVPEVRDVGEYVTGIDQIFVYVVEIVENHIAPEDELVQSLRPVPATLQSRGIAAVQLHQQRYPIGTAQIRAFQEQVADSDYLRSEQRPPAHADQLRQIFPEKKRGPHVWKHEHPPGNVSERQIVFCDLLEERLHNS